MPFNPFQKLPIDTDVPLPAGVVAPRIPYDEMEVGHSVLVPHREWGLSDESAAKMAHQASRRLKPKKFASRKEGDEGECTRIWRVE